MGTDRRGQTGQELPAVVGRMREHDAAMSKLVPDKKTTAEMINLLRRHGRTQE